MTDMDIIQDYLDSNKLTVVPTDLLKLAYKKFNFEFKKKNNR